MIARAALAALLAAAAAAAGGAPAAGVGAAARAEARALAERSARLPAKDRDRLGEPVAAVERELEAGRVWTALERLREARRLEAAAASRADARGAFDAQWEEASRALRSAVPRPAWGGAPAAARALGEASEATALPLLHASRAYAKITDDAAGRYYLGEAREGAAFGAFCRALPPVGRPAPAWRSVASELALLQERVDAAFVPPRSIDRHPDFIRLNASLKTARELDAAGLFAGAAYEYLTALEELGRIDEKPSASLPEVRSRLAAERAELGSSGRDESLGLLFVERAESDLEAGDAESAASASVIASAVAPAYRAMREPAPAAPVRPAAATVTLVRWPYT